MISFFVWITFFALNIWINKITSFKLLRKCVKFIYHSYYKHDSLIINMIQNSLKFNQWKIINTEKLELPIKAAITVEKAAWCYCCCSDRSEIPWRAHSRRLEEPTAAESWVERSVCEKKCVHIKENSNVLLLYRGIIVFSP